MEQDVERMTNDDDDDVTMTKGMMSELESDGWWACASGVAKRMSGDGR